MTDFFFLNANSLCFSLDTTDKASAGDIASQVMKNPQVLAALQQKLGSMVGAHSGYIQRYDFFFQYAFAPLSVHLVYQ